MSFQDTLQNVQKYANGIIDNETRDLLYEKLCRTTNNEAKQIYKELCYVYICVVNGQEINYKNINILKDIQFNVTFVKSLVDLGSLIDKVSDASILSPEQRQKKWQHERDEWNKQKETHAKNSKINEKWSIFLLKSRDQNKKAYEQEYNKIKNPKSNYETVIKYNVNDLQSKTPSFFYTIQTENLTDDAKRALIHKYSLIYNTIPDTSRQMTVKMCQDLFRKEIIKENEIEIKVRKNTCCTIM